MQPDKGVFETILERWSGPANTVSGRAPITLLDERGPRALSGAHLLALADSGAAMLAAMGVEPGDRVGLALKTGEAFLGTFFGAWRLGAAAVPLAPLSPRHDPAHEAARLARPFAHVGARVAVATPEAVELLAAAGIQATAPARGLRETRAEERGVQDAGALTSSAGYAAIPQEEARTSPDHLAVVQYSSGSTGHPRGVRLTHGNLLANIRAIGTVLQPGPADVGVAWLPLHHDMGLIGCLLFTQYFGVPLVLMAPEYFIRMPARWPAAMSRYGATMTSAPNFAYQLCAGLPDSHVAGLDLSPLRAVLVGAEPVRPRALQAFAARFAAHGFDPGAFVPTYGLAEATLAVTMTPPGAGMRTDRIDARTFETRHEAVPIEAVPFETRHEAVPIEAVPFETRHEAVPIEAVPFETRHEAVPIEAVPVGAAPGPSPETTSREVVGVGIPMPGLEVTVRHEDTGEPLAERQVGEICVAGPSVATGYFADAESTAAALCDGYLRTGDLGYFAGGELHVAGRIKDLIIKGGYKYHPQDLEAVAEEHGAVRIGGTSAFLVPRSEGQDERLVLVAEIAAAPEGREVGQEIRRSILEAAGVRVDEVVLVVPQQLPRTTSGKIRRAEARRRYLAGLLKSHEPSRSSPLRASR